MIRIAGARHTSTERQALVEAARDAFRASGMKVDAVLPLSMLRTAMGEHVFVLVGTLLALAAIITVIAVFGVTSNAATTVIERFREFGMMRAIGAPPALLVGVIAREGAYATILGCFAAAPLGWVLTRVIGGFVGRMAFNISLPAPFALGPFALWCAALLGASIIASAIPARRAAKITVREALSEV
jgi:putative ABC transport system permease protein